MDQRRSASAFGDSAWSGVTRYALPGATGQATAIAINGDTGKQLAFNVSGPSKTVNNHDGTTTLVSGGPNLLFTTRANSYPNVPELAFSTGRVEFTLSPSGKTTSYSLNGSRTNVCDALAA